MAAPLFHQGHYFVVAKRIRNRFPHHYDTDPIVKIMNTFTRSILADVAIDFARWFAKDNPDFDPIKFLDMCSPNKDTYPLSELWEGNEST